MDQQMAVVLSALRVSRPAASYATVQMMRFDIYLDFFVFTSRPTPFTGAKES
jgi:hypothetical protein